MIFVKYKYKYRIYHPVFGNTHTCVDFHTHVWFLPNTLTGLMYLVETTPVWFLPHTWKSMSSVVILTHVQFFSNNQNDVSKLMAIFILSIWRFQHQNIVPSQISFLVQNMQLFYILRLIKRFYIHHQHRNGYFNKETLLWLKRIKWKDMSQENLIEEADSFFGAIKTKRHDLAATQ